MKNRTLMMAAGTTLAIATLGIVGAVGASQVYAQDAEDGEAPLVVQNLAKAFGVSEDKVQTVFTETREQRHDEHMDEMVADGTLTEEQRELLEAKHEEMEAKREEIRNSSAFGEERREAMQEMHEEMQTWAEENGIDLPERGPGKGLGQGMGGGMGRGMGGGMHR